MEGPGEDNSVVRQIEQACHRAVVLLSPAAGGKTTAVIELYRHRENLAKGGACLLVAPNLRGAGYLRERLLAAEESGVLVAPQVVTFAGLAGRILAAGDKSGRFGIISAFKRRLLLRRIVDELHSAGRLAVLGGVADTPGLIVALDRSISELKRAAIEPDALARAIPPGRGKARELLEIYRRYQEHLVEVGDTRAVFLEKYPYAGGDGALGELELAHVALR